MTNDDGNSRSEIPKLEGWLSFPEAAEELGLSKQMVHKMVFVLGIFDIAKDVRSIGEKPIYVVRESKVLDLKEKRGEAH